MGLTAYLIPIALALFIPAVILLVQGIRRKSKARISASGTIFLLLLAGYAALAEFITRM